MYNQPILNIHLPIVFECKPDCAMITHCALKMQVMSGATVLPEGVLKSFVKGEAVVRCTTYVQKKKGV